jgi:hypothetical protein
MHLYRKFTRIYVCDRLIRLQTCNSYKKHNTETFAVQQSCITSWHVRLMFIKGKEKTTPVCSIFSYVSFHHVQFHSTSATDYKVTPTL